MFLLFYYALLLFESMQYDYVTNGTAFAGQIVRLYCCMYVETAAAFVDPTYHHHHEQDREAMS